MHARAGFGRLTWLLTGALAGAACDGPALHEGELSAASTVGDFGTASCSTAVVLGLSRQIAQEADCEAPGGFTPFTPTGGITFTSNAVLPFLAQGARDDLQTVAATAPLQVNSALRTLAQQYLLYQWYLKGRCGIPIAAKVGSSNHEGGRAVDLENYSARVTVMAAHGWAHDVAGDPVHFDHTSSPDARGADVKAFQVLWNRNHPTDLIATDGIYGPTTEARLVQSPATGFPLGATCGSGALPAVDVLAVDGPETVPPSARAHYAITVQNAGTTAWPASTALQVASGSASPLADPSWLSPTEITTLGAAVAPGAQATIELDITAPAAAVATVIAEPLELAEGSAAFGAIPFAVTVVPGFVPDGSGGSGGSGGADASGGCGAGGAGVGPLGVAALGALVRRRRRRQ